MTWSAAEPPLACGLLERHLEQAGQLAQLAGHDPLLAARLAAAGGEPELARAMLARTGGLFDAEESRRLLEEPCPPELLAAAAPLQQSTVDLSRLSATQREMYLRVLAGLLVAERPPAPQELCGQPAGQLLAGLWRLPALPERDRWAAGRQLLAALGWEEAQWVSSSWGGRWGLRRLLAAGSNAAEVPPTEAQTAEPRVLALEYVVATLSAAWNWELPDLPALLTRPALIEGLEALPASRLEMVTALLSDAAVLFGWTVVALPAFETLWPAEYRQLPAEFCPAPRPDAGPARALPAGDAPQTLLQLAGWLSAQPGRSLVVLYSRASAARLAGRLPGSVLLSSSLCRAHLDDRMTQLAGRFESAENLTVIATALPSSPLGCFDRVYHLMAPLPHLIEAAQLSCDASLTLLHLRDVAVPHAWERQSRLTAELLESSDLLNDPESQRQYAAQWRRLESGGPGGRWQELRHQGDYATLSSELNAPAGSAMPVLIPYGPGGEAAIARSRAQDWLSRQDLHYAAWMTPLEAQQAVRQGNAEPFGSGWAMVWCGPYDDTYGLAWPLIEADRQRTEG
ncbi:hypothetical protein [Deinococcus sp. Marseille-Q6407]|uniref:hypothetical protein n=1 Tax=Deinococcus sp. Marseille-Q6407 TaxID=2969223 RepID=UPI0021BFB740|nr:hypothetical protein [Deinococcus sp. Marseille-Q6407]